MYRSDPTKQILILAQSSMTKAVELMSQAKKFEDNNEYWIELQGVSRKLMAIQMKNAGLYIDSFNKLSKEANKEAVVSGMKECNTLKELQNLWSKLSEEEQVQNEKVFKELAKQLK